MRLALILFGLSYCKEYDRNEKYNGRKKGIFLVDYRKSIENYKKYIFNHFSKLGYEIDVFICTNNSSKEQNVLDDFKPKSYLFVGDSFDNIDHEDRNIRRYLSRNTKVINATKLCLEYSEKNNIKYKHVLITRFDLLFKRKFNDINYDKFNISFSLNKENDNKKICDNFYFLPFNMLNKFYKILKLSKFESTHNIYPLIKKKIENIHFILKNNPKKILENDFYSFVRIRID